MWSKDRFQLRSYPKWTYRKNESRSGKKLGNAVTNPLREDFEKDTLVEWLGQVKYQRYMRDYLRWSECGWELEGALINLKKNGLKKNTPIVVFWWGVVYYLKIQGFFSEQSAWFDKRFSTKRAFVRHLLNVFWPGSIPLAALSECLRYPLLILLRLSLENHKNYLFREPKCRAWVITESMRRGTTNRLRNSSSINAYFEYRSTYSVKNHEGALMDDSRLFHF